MFDKSGGKERTFLMIKPDGVERRLIGRIITRIEKEGFDIVAMEMMKLPAEKAELLYKAHRSKLFFLPLVDFITSGTVVALIVERDGGADYLRQIIGATDPAKAQEGTLRNELGTDVQKNVIHSAETKEDAEREINLLFGEL